MIPIFQFHSFLHQQKSLLYPSRSQSSGVVDDPVTGKFAVLVGMGEGAGHQAGILFLADETGNLAVGGYFSFRNFFYNRENFISKIFIKTGMGTGLLVNKISYLKLL